MRAGASFSRGGNNASDGMAADAWMSISETLTAGKPLRQVLSLIHRVLVQVSFVGFQANEESSAESM